MNHNFEELAIWMHAHIRLLLDTYQQLVILGKFELENFGRSKGMWFLKLMTYFPSKSLCIEW